MKPYYDSAEGASVITVSRAIYHPETKKLFAVVGADLLLKHFVEDIVSIKNSYDMDFIIADNEGNVIYKKGDEKELGHWQDKPERASIADHVGQQNMNAFTGMQNEGYQNININDVGYSIYKRKLHGVDWTLVGLMQNISIDMKYKESIANLGSYAVSSNEKISSAIKNYRYAMAVLFLMTIAIFVSLFYSLRKMILPLQMMERYSNEFPNYKKDDRLAIDLLARNDEVGSVMRSFEKLNEKIHEYQDTLEQNARLVAIGSSTAMVAHDVRRPLSSMKSLLTSLPYIKDDPQQMEKMISSVDLNIAQTNSMLNEVLDFSRDATALDIGSHDPQGIITSALGDALRNHPGCIVGMVYELRHRYCLQVDGVRTIRILTNILDNALDAMKHESGKTFGQLRIGSYDVEREGKRFVGITVADDGPGVSEEDLPRVFEPFFTKGKKGGTGLGLAICKRVVDMHGGRIFAKNNDTGAEFAIELPSNAERALINEDDMIHSSKELEVFRKEEAVRVEYGDTLNTAEFMRLNKERGRQSYLLIADDEPLFRETVRNLLNELGQVKDHIKVIEVDSAETALKVFEGREFDYLIADIDFGSGRMNGYDLSMTVLERYKNAHVLIHSNKRREELDIQLRGAAKGQKNIGGNFMGFLPKPMKASELMQFLACKTFEAPERPIRQAPQRNIIVLNDDESFNIGMKIDLKSHNIEVLDATNVSDAMKHFTDNAIDSIICDVNLGKGMPDGYDFLTKVREKDRDVPFVFVSGYPRSDIWPRAEKLGANAYLQIPFDDAELKSLLKI